MNVRFYSFSKRRNSTKQPTGTYVTCSCALKAPCSMHNPVLELAGGPQSSYDYAYIPDFARYYFVRDIVSESYDISSYYLEEDVLASHKTEIGNSRAFIAYASTGYDTMQIDSRIALKQTRTFAGENGGTMDNPLFNGGAYYLTVYNSNADAGSSGFSQTYQLNESAMDKVRRFFGASGIAAAISNLLGGNSMDAVYQCYWLPHRFVSTGSNTSKVWIGDKNNVDDATIAFTTGDQVNLLSGFPQVQRTVNLPIPYIHSDFRSKEPYTKAFVFLPGIGDLDVKLSEYTTNINISYTLEICTGCVTYLLFNDAGALIQSAIGNVASPCPMGKVNTAGGQLLTGLASTAGGVGAMFAGAALGGTGVLIGGAAAALSGVANTALAAHTHSPSVTGHVGGRGSLLWPYVTLTLVSINTEDPDDLNYIAEKGRPVGIVNGIGSYSGGYVQTIDAHIDCKGSEEERTEVENYLNSGIYYE